MSRLAKVYHLRRLSILNAISETFTILGTETLEGSPGDFWQAKWLNGTLTVSLVTEKSFFGVLISSMYLACIPETISTKEYLRQGEVVLAWKGGWRRSLPVFVAKKGQTSGLVEALNNDGELSDAITKGGIKSLRIYHAPSDDKTTWNIDLRPIAGSISGMVFPPVHPFEVPLKEEEVQAHYTILQRVASLLS